MTELQRFGERLAQLRRERAVEERRDIEQKDVAESVKTSVSNYSRYEAGLVKPRDDVLGRIAEYFGVRRAWLLWGEGERTARPVERAIDVVEQGVRQQDPADIPPETRRVVGRRGKSGRGR